MGVVEPSNWDDHVAHPDVELRPEALLDPELLELDLSSLLDFALPFSGLLELFLDCSSGAGMLELDLCLHGPALAEVVSEIDDGMRDVETAVLFTCVSRCRGITVNVIAEEVAAHGHFAVASYAQTLLGRCNESKKERCYEE